VKNTVFCYETLCSLIEIYQWPMPECVIKMEGQKKGVGVPLGMEWRDGGVSCFYFLQFFVRSAYNEKYLFVTHRLNIRL
jgi:hypothetical protein